MYAREQIFLDLAGSRQVEVRMLFYGLGIGSLLFGAIYHFSRYFLYSKRWISIHFSSLILFILLTFLAEFNAVQLSALQSGQVAREPFDDLLYLRVRDWSRHAFLTLLVAQIILPANLLLGWYNYRLENKA